MKTGYKTSEFWVMAVTSIVTLLNQSGALGGIVLPIEAIGTVAAMVFGYVVSRGMAKLNTDAG